MDRFNRLPFSLSNMEVILGDLFDVWIGDDDDTPYHRKIIETLRVAAEHTLPIYLMPGNHDFLIGKQFAQSSHITLLDDPSVIPLYQTPVLLTHGDSLCTRDRKHQLFRRTVAKPWVQKLILTLPLSWRHRGAERLLKKSQAHQNGLSSEKKAVVPNEVQKIMQSYRVHVLIHGHTHLPGIHSLTLSEKPAQRIVLGAWYDTPLFLRYFSDGQFELETLTLS